MPQSQSENFPKVTLLLLALIAVFFTQPALSQTYICSTAACSLATNATYDYIEVQNGGHLVIDAAEITFNGTSPYVLKVKEGGTLLVTNFSKLDLTGSGSRDIMIEPGGYMYVTNNSTLKMGTGCHIEVQSDYWKTTGALRRGGLFAMHNSELSGNYWDGVDVWGGNGNAGTNYFPSIGQKVARAIFTYSVIKGARTAVKNFNENNSTYPYLQGAFLSGGGVIEAVGCEFYDNGLAVDIEYYQNQTFVGSPLRNPCRFFDCDFYSTSTPIVAPMSYARLISVDEVLFRACNFSGNYNIGVPQRAGIELYDAGLRVEDGCVTYGTYSTVSSNCQRPIPGALPSTFHNMKKAIVGRNRGGARGVQIYSTDFFGISEVAIELSGYMAPQIINNEIHLVTNTGTEHSGIVLEGCTNYRVEENRLNAQSNNKTFGIVLDESGSNYNEIVLNKLVKVGNVLEMGYALQANGLNYDLITPSNGLRFFCNDLQLNEHNDAFDISVNDLPGSPTPAIYGIAGLQAHPFNNKNQSTRNLFAPKSLVLGTDENHLYDLPGSNPFYYYYYYVPAEVPVYYTAASVNIYIAAEQKSCPDHSSYNNHWEYVGDFINKRTVQSANIAGETPGAVDPETGGYGYFAYDEYLTAYAQNNNNMIHQYMHMPEEYSPFMLDSIGIDTVIVNEDTSRLNHDSLMLVLDGTEYIYDYKVWLACMYAGAGDFSAADDELDDILAEYSLSSDEEDKLADIRTMFGIIETLADNDNDWTAVATTDKEWLEDMAAGGGYMRYWSRYFLGLYEDVVYEPEVVTISMAAAKPTGVLATTDDGIAIYPNPAYDKLTIRLEQAEASATVMDMYGRVVGYSTLQYGINQIDISSLAPGVYVTSIHRDGKEQIKQRFIKK